MQTEGCLVLICSGVNISKENIYPASCCQTDTGNRHLPKSEY